MRSVFFKKTRILFSVTLVLCQLLQAQSPVAVTREMVYCLSAVKGTQPWYNPDERAHDMFDGDFVSSYQSVISSSAGQAVVVPVVVVVELKQGCQINQIQFGYQGEGTTPLQVQVQFGRPGQWSAPGTWNGQYNNTAGPNQIFTTNLTLTEQNRFLKFTFQQVFRGGVRLIGTGSCSWSLPAYDPALMPKTPMERFIGTNSNIGINNHRTPFLLAPFGSLREYVNWTWSEGGPEANSTPSYPTNNRYYFAPTLPEGSDNNYDSYFRQVKEMGVEVLADMMSTTPGIISVAKTGTAETMLNQSPACNKEQFWERKPANVPFGQSTNYGNEFFIADPNASAYSNPSAYVRQADRLFQFTARYGRSGPATTNDLKFAASNPALKYLGLVDFVENWNESDKWWFAPDPQGNCGTPNNAERRRMYFTPLEYAAMTLADHNDPNMYALTVPNSTRLGMRRADPNMPSVMSGISEFDLEYLKGIYMALWDLTGNAQAWPFKAVGLHHYAFEDSHGMHPEQDFDIEYNAPGARLKEIMRFVQHKLPAQTEVWVTEFGWSSSAQDGSSALPDYSGADVPSVQAQWVLRQMLLYQSAGIQRAYQFSLVNTLSGGGGLFAYCGAAGMQFGGSGATVQLKPLWYAVYTLRNALYGMTIQNHQQLNVANKPVVLQRYSNQATQKSAYVLWSPTESNTSVNGVTIMTGQPNTEVTIVQIANGKINGTRITATTNATGQLTIPVPVTEMPLMVVMQDAFMPACDCHVPVAVVSQQPGASQLVNEQAALTNSNLLCGFGPAMNQYWQTNGGTAQVWLRNAQNENVPYNVHGVYIHYAPWSNAEVNVKFYDAVGQEIAYRGATGGYTFKTDDFSAGYWGAPYVWRRLEHLQMAQVARVDVTVLSGSAALGEIAVCGILAGDIIGGGDEDTGGPDTIDVNCPAPIEIGSIGLSYNPTQNTVRVRFPISMDVPDSAYTITYRRGQGSFTTFTGSLKTVKNTRKEFTLTDMATCADLTVKVCYKNACGAESTPRTRQIYLDQGCTLSAPTGLSQTAADCDRAIVSWQQAGVPLPSKYQYQAFVTTNSAVTKPNNNNAIAVNGLPALSVLSQQHQLVVPNLAPGLTYYVFIRVRSNNNQQYTTWQRLAIQTRPVSMCSNCICNWTPLSESMVSYDNTSVSHPTVDPTKLVDEQEFIIDNLDPCELLPATPLTGPSTEMGEHWGPTSQSVVARFNVNLPAHGMVRYIRLYDGDGCQQGLPDADGDGCADQAAFSIEYRKHNQNTWLPLVAINTHLWRAWRTFEVNEQVAQLRITKHHNHARINEMAVCLTPPTQALMMNPTATTQQDAPTQALRLSVYPNPTTDFIMVDAPNDVNLQYRLMAVSGELIRSGTSPGALKLRVSDLPKGVYSLHVAFAESHMTEQFIKL
jgi:hypothetical protein